MLTDYFTPGSQSLTSDQVNKILLGIFHGPATQYAQTWAADMTRIGGAEGGGQSGIVVNTAYPDLPNYYTTGEYFPGIAASPEYSVGLFGEDIKNGGSYNLVASVLGEPGLPAGQAEPTSTQAKALADKFGNNPSAQAVVAYRMFQGAGNAFAPWTEATATGTPSPGGLPTGETIQASGTVGLSSTSGTGPPTGSTPPAKGTGGTTGSASSDKFTAAMQGLNNLMHPEFTFLSIIKPSSYQSLIVMFLVRGGFAVGFAAIGVVGALKLASGGKVGAGDLPGLVAGFVAGPEAGLANLAGKMFGSGVGNSLKPQRQPTEMEQARLSLGQERLDLQRRKGYVSAMQRQQGMMQQAERTAQQQQQFQTRMQERQERAATQQQQFAERQQSTAQRFDVSRGLREVGLQQGQQRLQQGTERAELGRQALAERVTSRISQARARGVRERRMAGVQAHREQIYPAEYAIRRRKQDASDVRNSLRERQIALQEWRAGFGPGSDQDYDAMTLDYDN
jgi:hypothetical protein